MRYFFSLKNNTGINPSPPYTLLNFESPISGLTIFGKAFKAKTATKCGTF